MRRYSWRDIVNFFTERSGSVSRETLDRFLGAPTMPDERPFVLVPYDTSDTPDPGTLTLFLGEVRRIYDYTIREWEIDL